jgi:hypothetical protein
MLDDESLLSSPNSIFESILFFESGQVYQVLTRNSDGTFVPFKKHEGKD